MTYLTDGAGNKCSVEHFGTHLAAQAALDSLKDCLGCWNCSSCSNCSNCSNCSDCVDCENCLTCSECVDCLNLIGKTIEDETITVDFTTEVVAAAAMIVAAKTNLEAVRSLFFDTNGHGDFSQLEFQLRVTDTTPPLRFSLHELFPGLSDSSIIDHVVAKATKVLDSAIALMRGLVVQDLRRLDGTMAAQEQYVIDRLAGFALEASVDDEDTEEERETNSQDDSLI